MDLPTFNKANVSGLELKRRPGGCYDTAWKLKHKIGRIITEREALRQLNDFVQLDDAYFGGERNVSKPGCGSENKQLFVVVVADETLEHPPSAVIEPVHAP